MKLTDEEAHRRALADVNGDHVRGALFELLLLAAFVACVIAAVALASGHLEINIRIN